MANYSVKITRNHPEEAWRYRWQLMLDDRPVKAVDNCDRDRRYYGETDFKWTARREARQAIKRHRKVLAHNQQGPLEWVYVLKRGAGGVESHPKFAELKARYARDEISLEEFSRQLEPLIKG